MRGQPLRAVAATLVSFMVITGLQHRACAQQGVSQEDLLKEIRALKETVKQQTAKIEELEKRVTRQETQAAVPADKSEFPPDLSKKIEDHLAKTIPSYPLLSGVDIGGWATMIVQGAHDANGSEQLSRNEDVTDASYTADFTVEKKFEECGAGFLHFRAGNGAGVTDELQVFSNVNYNAVETSNNVRLIELWYEYYCQSLPFTLTVGKIDAISYIDSNEYAYDETTQFLGDMFANSPVIEFPSSNGEAGLHVSLKPSDVLLVDLVATDSNGSGEDVFDALFLAGQLTFSPRFAGKNGNYRLIFWENGAAHTRWLDSTKDKEHGFGWGVSFDQACTDTIGVFARYGWQDPDVFLNANEFSLEQAYSFGPQIKGTAWGRPLDVAGLALGQVFPSQKYKKANSLIAKPESHLEAYYNFKVNKYFAVSPDVQVIWNPYGKDAANGDDCIMVTGMRAEIDF